MTKFLCGNLSSTRGFQSTHPRRVWLSFIGVNTVWNCFNPHTHEGCDILLLVIFLAVLLFQSTHPRRVWRIKAIRQMSVSDVSIHTPTKGVTDEVKTQYYQHHGFNPHTHEGCDKAKIKIYLKNIGFQSTHPRRVWLPKLGKRQIICLRFNPHTHEGCDFAKVFLGSNTALFQSTHPRRVWLKPLVFITLCLKFQSTHPRRVWLIGIC